MSARVHELRELEVVPAPRELAVVERRAPEPRGEDDAGDPRVADDAVSIDALYRREFAFVWRLARYFGVPAAAVEDVVHDVFIAAYQQRASYDPARGSARGWLYGITRHTALHHHRSARRRDPRRLPAQASGGAGEADPERHVARRQAARAVEAFLGTLSPERREVFTLHDVEGLSAPAIAALLGIKLNTVYSRLRRARESFRKAVLRHRARERRLRSDE